MLPDEALEALGLGPDATAAEIKEAYRDLVKVWHPDRFGTDLRLRRKAEEKLQQINLAYRVLQSYSGPFSVFRRRKVRPKAIRRIGKARHVLAWSIAGSGFAVVLVAVVIVLRHRSQETIQIPVIPAARIQEPMSGSSANAPPKTEQSFSSNKTNNRLESPSFRVRQLSDEEVARLETACRSVKETQDLTKYQDCLRDQLGTTEPDMSTLNAEDRSGIRSACKKTKISEGLAGYNRCLTRMVKLLRESSGP